MWKNFMSIKYTAPRFEPTTSQTWVVSQNHQTRAPTHKITSLLNWKGKFSSLVLLHQLLARPLVVSHAENCLNLKFSMSSDSHISSKPLVAPTISSNNNSPNDIFLQHNWHLTSVTRLANFSNVLATIFIMKVAQNFRNFSGYLVTTICATL